MSEEITEEIEENVEEDQGSVTDSDEVMIELPDGTQVPIEEAKRGYLRQSDYTKKTTMLAEQRKEYDRKLAEAEEFQRGINYYWQQHPEEYERMVNFYEKGQVEETKQESSKGDNPQNKAVEDKPLRNPEYDRQLYELRKERIEDQVHGELDSLAREYEMSEEEMSDFSRVAQENWNQAKDVRANMRNAFKVWDYENGLKKSQLRAEKQRLEKMKAGVGGRSHGGAQKAKSDAELVREAFFSKTANKPGFRL